MSKRYFEIIKDDLKELKKQKGKRSLALSRILYARRDPDQEPCIIKGRDFFFNNEIACCSKEVELYRCSLIGKCDKMCSVKKLQQDVEFRKQQYDLENMRVKFLRHKLWNDIFKKSR